MNPLKKARLDAYLNQTALAKKAGVERATISELENGIRKANALTLSKLAGALNIPIEDLASLEVDPNMLSARGKKANAARLSRQKGEVQGQLVTA